VITADILAACLLCGRAFVCSNLPGYLDLETISRKLKINYVK
jgi:hypothetical protein